MKILLSICFMWIAFQYSSANADDERIIGGTNATDRIKYMVSLQNNHETHMCGGCLISQNWILTAAHCVKNNPTIVAVGANSLSSTEMKRYSLNPLKRFIHEKNIEVPFYYYDIGLLKTNSPIPSSSLIEPVLFPYSYIGDNKHLKVTGWGQTKYPGGKTSDNLQILTTKTVSIDKCTKDLNVNTTDLLICTLTKVGEGMCFGDSGSPLVDIVTGTKSYIHGIVTSVIPCALGYQDFSVNVYHPEIRAWILNTVLRE